jgi:hypothetical protein
LLQIISCFFGIYGKYPFHDHNLILQKTLALLAILPVFSELQVMM